MQEQHDFAVQPVECHSEFGIGEDQSMVRGQQGPIQGGEISLTLVYLRMYQKPFFNIRRSHNS